MRSIERVFTKTRMRSCNLAAYPCLVQVVKYKKFSRKSLVKAFKNLVPIEDYKETETKELVDYLEHCSSLVEEVEI